MQYSGQCHCGSVKFAFDVPQITEGLTCNCSLCVKKDAIMSAFVVSEAELQRDIQQGALSTYNFGTEVAKHHFCNQCGIYPFHQTLRKPGFYRVNLNCVDDLDLKQLSLSEFDGANLL
ncbi:MAG: GFA family protein [Marinomonas sp.]